MRGLLGRSQSLLPQAQYHTRCIQVSIHMHTTIWTIEYPIRQTQSLIGSQPVPTTTTGLGRVRGFDPDKLTGSGPSCLHTHQPQKPTPRSIRDALGQTMIVHHPVDLQIFDRYQSEAIYNTTGVLVREIVPSPRRTLVHPSYNLAPPGSMWRILLLFAEFAEACAVLWRELSVRYGRNVDWGSLPR